MFQQLYIIPSLLPLYLLTLLSMLPSFPFPARSRISSSFVPCKEMKQLLVVAPTYCIFPPRGIFQNFLLQILKSVHAKI